MRFERSPAFDLARLRQHTWVRHLDYFESVVSTNTVALELARQPDVACPALVLSEKQTAGRGRGSNRWWSAEGALTFSLLWEPPHELERINWPKIALTTAVAICRTLSRYTPNDGYGIRWPNDVYTSGKKIAGILVEVPAQFARFRQRLVVGVGLNVNNSMCDAPVEIHDRGCSLFDLTHRESCLTDVLVDLLQNMSDDLDRLIAGSRDLVADWRMLCLLQGAPFHYSKGAVRFAVCATASIRTALCCSTAGQV